MLIASDLTLDPCQPCKPQTRSRMSKPLTSLLPHAAASADEDGEEVAESSGVSPNQQLHMKRDRALVLFGGTRILQHTPDKHARIKTPDGGCLAYVLRTGFETAQGTALVQFSSADDKAAVGSA